MLDNVLDVTMWPLKEQNSEAQLKRRVGLGVIGLGDALIMLRLGYNTQQGRDCARSIMKTLTVTAYEASTELARERGSFPLFNAEKYLQSPFIQRLPQTLQNKIRDVGIRNSHLISIAPTGTISLAFADNASGGIEPVFEWKAIRKKRMPDHSVKEYLVEDHAYRLYNALNGDNAGTLPSYFVNAQQLSVDDHLQMLGAVAPFVDSAISKTVNVPSDYPFEDFSKLYLTAWKLNLKGLTTFRPNDVTGSILSPVPQERPPEERNNLDQSDPDRRITVTDASSSTLASMRWMDRPTLPNGTPGWVYMVEHPHGYKFAVFISHIQNGTNYPFEVWVNGAEQPRGLGALAKSLSMDMRSNDRQWLRYKLEALTKTKGDDAFDLVMPDNKQQHAPSIVSAFAQLVTKRINDLAIPSVTVNNPVLDSLFSKKEPKSGPEGTISWTVDILNPNTGDDFVLGLKELRLQDQLRPYSVWLSGDYPRVLDGLCKSLSLDMRVTDLAWIGAKLRQMSKFVEPQGNFFAKTPGAGGKSKSYPSTVAYIASLIMYRYQSLGILDEDGLPMEPVGSKSDTPLNVVSLKRSVGSAEVNPNRVCPECGGYSIVKYDGCNTCTACGYKGACG